MASREDSYDRVLKPVIRSVEIGRHGIVDLRTKDDNNEEAPLEDLYDPPTEESERLPPPPEDVVEEELTAEDKLRRSEERKAIKALDTKEINNRKECWFIIDSQWLKRWTKFVTCKGTDPGQISNERLLDEKYNLLPNLEVVTHYRAVNSYVWAFYVEMYGAGEAPDPICRYIVDVYSEPVPYLKVKKILIGPDLKARVLGQKIREKTMEWPEYPDDPMCECHCDFWEIYDWVYLQIWDAPAYHGISTNDVDDWSDDD